MTKRLSIKKENLSKLTFLSPQTAEKQIRAMFKHLGVKMKIEKRNADIMQWRINSDLDLDDLCNIFNELGFKGISITASAKVKYL